MHLRLWFIFATLLLADNAYSRRPARRSYATHSYYVLEHDPTEGATVHDCAAMLGLEIVEQAGELQNHWLLRVPHSRISPREPEEDPILNRLHSLRSSLDISPNESHNRMSMSIRSLSRQVLRQRKKRAPLQTRSARELDTQNRTAEALAVYFGIEDPLFTKQWHLVNDENPEYMMNVAPVWDLGITGKGVITSLVDDGLDFESDDLAANFDAADSHDFNDHVPLPKPMLFDDHHGTRCAGQIAAVKNDVCGVGVAYDSKVAGVRILSGPISDVDEAAALNYGFQNVSIYSCSWGPPDDGRSMEAPSALIQKAIVNGVQNGRAGKGSIFVFASGNGAGSHDQCNFDGYTNSIYSVTVAAVDHKGMHPPYSEACAANLVVAYSSGSSKGITTTDVGKDKCSSAHGGTSAAAPNAAGVIALALEARPDLTWRDIQHLCVKTAVKINPDDPDWEDTATGNRYSYKYGYGAVDAYQFVKEAQSWKVVKPQAWFSSPTNILGGGLMDHSNNMTGGELITAGGITSTITVTTQITQEYNFESLEHVTITVWISHTKRGDVEVELVSPNGVKSILAGQRQLDRDPDGFPGWTFMSVKHWGEDPVGQWSIRVSDQGAEGHTGSFLGWNMNFFGSTIDPVKAKPYLVPSENRTFPPSGEYGTPLGPSFTIIQPISTKQYGKPTDHLPSDHPGSAGEKTKPAFPSATHTASNKIDISQPESTASQSDDGPSGTMTPTPDEGWFSDMSSLVHRQKWVFGSIAVVLVFGLCVGAYFIWRRQQRWRRHYGLVSNDDEVAMSSLSGTNSRLVGGDGARTRELYDAFGGVSDEDDADEGTGLQQGSSATHAADYHTGFRDDATAYRDHPDKSSSGVEAIGGSPVGSGSGSADGSWEHASQTR